MAGIDGKWRQKLASMRTFAPMEISVDDWEDVVAYARRLPGVEMVSFYGTQCPKVNGKAIVAPGHEVGSFCLFTTSIDEKMMLIETEPATYWQTDHYRRYPCVLVRYGTGSRERVATYISRSWWDRANKRQRQSLGERP